MPEDPAQINANGLPSCESQIDFDDTYSWEDFTVSVVDEPKIMGVGIARAWELHTGPALMITYGKATEDQKKAVFPNRRSRTEPLWRHNFSGTVCFELWNKGKLVGLCTLMLGGIKAPNFCNLTLTLNAIYIRPRYRNKGYMNPFLDEVARAATVKIQNVLYQAAQEGAKELAVEISAELHSLGGQAAICYLGMSVEEPLLWFTEATGVGVDITLITDAW